MRIPPPLAVDPRDVVALRAWVTGGTVGAAAVRRARIVLLSGQGYGPSVVAAELGCSKQTVITWRERYRSDGVGGLRDAPRSGRPATVDTLAVLRHTLQPPPAGHSRWSSRLLAAELGISNVAVANVWRSWGVRPGVSGKVQLAVEPTVDGVVCAVVGLHADPALRLLALLVGGPDHRPVHIELDDGGPEELPLFLSRLDAACVEGMGVQGGAVEVLMDERLDGAGAAVKRWAAARTDVALHVVHPRTAASSM